MEPQNPNNTSTADQFAQSAVDQTPAQEFQETEGEWRRAQKTPPLIATQAYWDSTRDARARVYDSHKAQMAALGMTDIQPMQPSGNMDVSGDHITEVHHHYNTPIPTQYPMQPQPPTSSQLPATPTPPTVSQPIAPPVAEQLPAQPRWGRDSTAGDSGINAPNVPSQSLPPSFAEKALPWILGALIGAAVVGTPFAIDAINNSKNVTVEQPKDPQRIGITVDGER